MKTQFVKYTDLTDAAETIMKKSKVMDVHSALFWAIHDFCGVIEYFTFAEYGAFADFTGEAQRAYTPDTFGLCAFSDRDAYLAFWRYCAER